MSYAYPNQIVVPAAGFGTRLLPGSKAIPKEMFPIVNRPGIEYIASEAVDAGITNIILVTSKNKDSLVDHFDSNTELEHLLESKNKISLLNSIQKFKDINFVNVRQSKALGLGHAVYSAKSALGEKPFIVSLPDMLVDNGHVYTQQMCNIYQQTGKAVIALMEVPMESVSSYGVVNGKLNGDGTVDIYDLVEKPTVDKAPSNLAVLGRYVLPYKVIDILENVKPDHTGEIQLTTALQILARENGMIGVIVKSEIHDIGSPCGFIKANIYYGIKYSVCKDEIVEYIKNV